MGGEGAQGFRALGACTEDQSRVRQPKIPVTPVPWVSILCPLLAHKHTHTQVCTHTHTCMHVCTQACMHTEIKMKLSSKTFLKKLITSVATQVIRQSIINPVCCFYVYFYCTWPSQHKYSIFILMLIVSYN